MTSPLPADPPGRPHPPARAGEYAPLPAERAERWARFGRWDERYFPNVVGLEVDEVRLDYARLRLPFRPELRQPAGAVHGGAIATMIDTVCVPAIGGGYDRMPGLATIDLQIRYLGAARATDLVAEGWVVKRGRSIVFCQAEVRSDPGDELIAEGWSTFRVVPVD